MFFNVLNKREPLKKKRIGANNASHVSNSMQKAIMGKPYLETAYFQKGTTKSLRAHKKQNNYCNRLHKMEYEKLFSNLNTFFVDDIKFFWKIVKPLFSNKQSSGNNSKFVEKYEVLQDDKEGAKELKTFLKKIRFYIRY